MPTSIKRISIRSIRAPKQLSLMTSSFGRSSSRSSSSPRLTAYPMKKQLNINGITNELQGGSAFFPGYKEDQTAVPAPVPTSAHTPRETPTVKPVPPVRVVPPVPLERGTPSAPKRVMKQRHPFDIYRDQYDALQELALEERKQGGIGSMSAMVREALDSLIVARKAAKKSTRTPRTGRTPRTPRTGTGRPVRPVHPVRN